MGWRCWETANAQVQTNLAGTLPRTQAVFSRFLVITHTWLCFCEYGANTTPVPWFVYHLLECQWNRRTTAKSKVSGENNGTYCKWPIPAELRGPESVVENHLLNISLKTIYFDWDDWLNSLINADFDIVSYSLFLMYALTLWHFWCCIWFTFIQYLSLRVNIISDVPQGSLLDPFSFCVLSATTRSDYKEVSNSVQILQLTLLCEEICVKKQYFSWVVQEYRKHARRIYGISHMIVEHNSCLGCLYQQQKMTKRDMLMLGYFSKHVHVVFRCTDFCMKEGEATKQRTFPQEFNSSVIIVTEKKKGCHILYNMPHDANARSCYFNPNHNIFSKSNHVLFSA